MQSDFEIKRLKRRGPSRRHHEFKKLKTRPCPRGGAEGGANGGHFALISHSHTQPIFCYNLTDYLPRYRDILRKIVRGSARRECWRRALNLRCPPARWWMEWSHHRQPWNVIGNGLQEGWKRLRVPGEKRGEAVQD